MLQQHLIMSALGNATGGGVAYLLDTYSAVAGYSVARRLKAAATNCIRVRTSGDSYATGANIGFSGANMDTSALTTAVGGGNTGVIETIFDQVSSSDLSQSTNANRPTIVSTGSILTLGANSKPRANFDSTDTLSTSSARPNFGTDLGLSGNAAWSVFIVHRKTTNTNGCLFGWGNTGVSLAAAGVYDDGSVNNVSWAGANDFKLTVAGNNTLYLTSVFKAAGAINSTTSVYRNGVSVASTGHSTGTPNVSGNFPLVLARWANFSSAPLIGDIQELIVFASDQSANRVAIETNINTYYGIW